MELSIRKSLSKLYSIVKNETKNTKKRRFYIWIDKQAFNPCWAEFASSSIRKLKDVKRQIKISNEKDEIKCIIGLWFEYNEKKIERVYERNKIKKYWNIETQKINTRVIAARP